MSSSTTQPELLQIARDPEPSQYAWKSVGWGTEEFWTLYDWFMHRDRLIKLSENELVDHANQVHMLAAEAQRGGKLQSLQRPCLGWSNPHAYLVLKYQMIPRPDGQFGINVSAGDVMFVEYGWDRDSIMTHGPIHSQVSGYFLSGKWPEMIGLFLPIFGFDKVIEAIQIRIKQNAIDSVGYINISSEFKAWVDGFKQKDVE